MNILVIGGTRFFGIPMIEELLKSGHDVTIATRGLSADSFGSRVKRLILDRTDAQSVRNALSGRHFDVIIDKLAYCSNDIKSVMDAADFDRYIQMSTTAVYDLKHINTMESDFDVLAKELVWCDRPDLRTDAEVIDELVRLNGEGTTILMVTHDAKVAARCSRVLYIVDGNIQGEYNNTDDGSKSQKERERALNNWLMEQGW